MTQDTYYAQEDAIRGDELELSLDTFAQRAAQLASAEDVRGVLSQAEHALGALYEQAGARGDTAAAGHIEQAWQRAQALCKRSEQTTETLAGALAVAGKLAAQRRAFAQELSELIAAVQTADYAHPEVGALIEWVQEQDAQDTDFYIVDIVIELITSVTPVTYEDGIEFARLILGDYDDASIDRMVEILGDIKRNRRRAARKAS